MKNLTALVFIAALGFAGAAHADSCVEDAECMQGKMQAAQIDHMQDEVDQMKPVLNKASELAESVTDGDDYNGHFVQSQEYIEQLIADSQNLVNQSRGEGQTTVNKNSAQVDANLKEVKRMDAALNRQTEELAASRAGDRSQP